MPQTRNDCSTQRQTVISTIFKCRENLINDITKYFPSIVSGNPQHFYITGKRRIDKTSLAKSILDIAGENYSMVTVYINDGVRSVDELIIHIIERLLKAIKLSEKIEFNKSKIKFKPTSDELKSIKDNFAFYLSDLFHNINDKNGIFIVIDDINGLSNTQEFANWYKSFTDTMATSLDNAPIGLMLTSDPEEYVKLYHHNPSMIRIFHVHKLDMN